MKELKKIAQINQDIKFYEKRKKSIENKLRNLKKELKKYKAVWG